MKIFKFLKRNNKTTEQIYQEAFELFDFDYSVESGLDDNGRDEPLFREANAEIDTTQTYELKEVDYFA